MLVKMTKPSVLPAVAVVTVVGALFAVTALTQASGYENRTVDGMGNNIDNPGFGSAGIQLLRMADNSYNDGISTLTSADKSAREISNILSAQTDSIPNSLGVSDFFWQWGQFLAHDIDLTTGAEPTESSPISVPAGDPYFDPGSTGTQTIPFNRSIFDPDSGTNKKNPREQLNVITAFVDASNVYGSDVVRTINLRTNDGTGKLKTSAGDFLPFNTVEEENAGGTGPELFLAGDIRANEQIYLTAMHTLFLREHNRLAEEIAAEDPGLNGEEIYQRARKIIGAQMQVITYNEFLPLLLGTGTLPPYTGYDEQVNPALANEFSTAAFRFGHSMLPEILLRLNKNGNSTGDIALKDAFFNPPLLKENGGVASLLRGLAAQEAQEVDTLVTDAVRNFLFGPPGSGGFDLASLNIQRCRDHGLARLNEARKAYGLKHHKKFSDITLNATVQLALEAAYDGGVKDVELWVGILAEDHVAGALVGETGQAILADQFIRLRNGDRFWYQNDPFFTNDDDLLEEVKDTTLVDIIRRNTDIGDEIQDNAFLVP